MSEQQKKYWPIIDNQTAICDTVLGRGEYMDFYALQDMNIIPQSVWDTLAVDNEVVLADGGKPAALLVNISDSNLEELLKAVRQIKTLDSFNAMRKRAAMTGFRQILR